MRFKTTKKGPPITFPSMLFLDEHLTNLWIGTSSPQNLGDMLMFKVGVAETFCLGGKERDNKIKMFKLTTSFVCTASGKCLKSVAFVSQV